MSSKLRHYFFTGKDQRGLGILMKYVIVSQSNDNCLQSQHIFRYSGLKDKSLNLPRNLSFLIGWKITTKIT